MEINELKIEDIKEGQGVSVKEGDIVEVNYTGTLTNGTKFDSSYDRNETFQFNVGAGQVIQGWEKGLVGMKKGGIRKLTIPSSLAYGEQGVPGAIPPNSPLIFEIELVSIN
ncbi:MAG: peptidylprolyl isomerase [Candidatus Levybacteria bacterium RIFCSPLOWO2_01_FULL_36_13]|nr:MAG: peptidylprolyl isomerase [Candidatus Levybacteria bacterium RIFCSPHIGHO2_01_FULL_36_15b]OGH35694.1 MAG: peptidylprolyl isomerase [Candidatus Levybacteria bacterium RIFCSPLOWO2_01_FULL_36_13]